MSEQPIDRVDPSDSGRAQPSPEPQAPTPATGPNGFGDWLRSPAFWLAVACTGLLGLVYAPLFFPPSVQKIALQSEEFFFEANEAAGAPVLVLSLWLFYRRSHYRDLLLSGGAPALGLPVLGLAAALYAWGHLAGAPDLQLASVVFALSGAALMLGGRAALRAYWVPIVFLAFALPLPPVLLSWAMFPIQLMTAEYAGFILNAMGVDSLVQGDQILRPENTFIVIETCSGVRTIVTLTMLTVLLIDLFERRGRHAVALLVLAPLVAFLTNGIRVVTLVLNPHSSIHSIHNLQGIVMLLVGLTMIYALDLLLEYVFGDPPPVEGELGGRVRTVSSQGGGIDRVIKLSAVAATLLVMTIVSRTVTPWDAPTGISEMPDALLVRVFGENSRTVKPDYQFRGSIRYLAHANRQVRIDGERVEVFLGVANEQIREHTMLTKRLAWPESGFVPVEESVISLDPENGGPEVRRMVLRRGARSVVSYSWVARSGSLASEWLRHAAALDRSPFAREERMLAIRLSAPFGRGRETAEQVEERLREAWRRLAPALETYAPTHLAGAAG